MADDVDRKLELRLAQADGQPADPQVIDDIIRLIRQGLATAPKQYPKITSGGEFREPSEEEKVETCQTEAQIKHRIDEASRQSETEVAKRAETAALPDGEQRLAEQSLKAAEAVVNAVYRAMFRGVKPEVPADEKPASP